MPKHIVRLIVVIVVVGAVAVVARSFLVADSFYEFGHYRGNSVIQIAAREPVYQTPRYCEDCHAERVAQWSAHSHKTVICEVCHGPAKGHPENRKMPIPTNTVQLCTLCHEAMPGRPLAQPQIDVATHSAGQQCIACHNPHAPRIIPAAARVAGDAAAGHRRAKECSDCHGESGASDNDDWPSLAAQSAPYLVRILSAYKSGSQHDEVMSPIAHELSDADVQNLAIYYAGLTCAPPQAKPAVSGDVAAGQTIARNCARCHGETGVARNVAWPSLAGQKPGYLATTLKAFRAGLRKDPIMTGVARGLSDADIQNLAAFFAGQRCEPVKQAGRAS